MRYVRGEKGPVGGLRVQMERGRKRVDRGLKRKRKKGALNVEGGTEEFRSEKGQGKEENKEGGTKGELGITKGD